MSREEGRDRLTRWRLVLGGEDAELDWQRALPAVRRMAKLIGLPGAAR